MCLVNSHSLGTQNDASIPSLGQEHGSELRIALDPPEQS